MIDYCISSFKEYNETLTYRIFETELLKGIAQRMDLTVEKNLLELLEPPKEEKPKETADDIITRIKGKLGERG